MDNNTIDRINEQLLRLPSAEYAQGNSWIIARCKNCQDSLNPNHKHFGIHIPQHENDVYYYNCFKCHDAGQLSTDNLIAWGIYDLDVIEGLSKWNKRVLSRPENRMYKDQTYIVKNNHITQSRLTDAKLNYINNRLGINMTYQDILDKKIILNLHDFLIENHITRFSRNPNVVDQLDKAFLGFLSQDNAFINMRRLINEDKLMKPLHKRYVNYNIFGKFDNSQRYYTIPTIIRLDNPKRIKLKIAEGPFDLLSIFYNMCDQEIDNCIYSAITGSSYLKVLEYFIIKKKLINIEADIYTDKDISDAKMYDIKQILNVFGIPLTVHRNIAPNQKDFGVKSSQIQDKIIYLG